MATDITLSTRTYTAVKDYWTVGGGTASLTGIAVPQTTIVHSSNNDVTATTAWAAIGLSINSWVKLSYTKASVATYEYLQLTGDALNTKTLTFTTNINADTAISVVTVASLTNYHASSAITLRVPVGITATINVWPTLATSQPLIITTHDGTTEATYSATGSGYGVLVATVDIPDAPVLFRRVKLTPPALITFGRSNADTTFNGMNGTFVQGTIACALSVSTGVTATFVAATLGQASLTATNAYKLSTAGVGTYVFATTACNFIPLASRSNWKITGDGTYTLTVVPTFTTSAIACPVGLGIFSRTLPLNIGAMNIGDSTITYSSCIYWDNLATPSVNSTANLFTSTLYHCSNVAKLNATNGHADSYHASFIRSTDGYIYAIDDDGVSNQAGARTYSKKVVVYLGRAVSSDDLYTYLSVVASLSAVSNTIVTSNVGTIFNNAVFASGLFGKITENGSNSISDEKQIVENETRALIFPLAFTGDATQIRYVGTTVLTLALTQSFVTTGANPTALRGLPSVFTYQIVEGKALNLARTGDAALTVRSSPPVEAVVGTFTWDYPIYWPSDFYWSHTHVTAGNLIKIVGGVSTSAESSAVNIALTDTTYTTSIVCQKSIANATVFDTNPVVLSFKLTYRAQPTYVAGSVTVNVSDTNAGINNVLLRYPISSDNLPFQVTTPTAALGSGTFVMHATTTSLNELRSNLDFQVGVTQLGLDTVPVSQVLTMTATNNDLSFRYYPTDADRTAGTNAFTTMTFTSANYTVVRTVYAQVYIANPQILHMFDTKTGLLTLEATFGANPDNAAVVSAHINVTMAVPATYMIGTQATGTSTVNMVSYEQGADITSTLAKGVGKTIYLRLSSLPPTGDSIIMSLAKTATVTNSQGVTCDVSDLTFADTDTVKSTSLTVADTPMAWVTNTFRVRVTNLTLGPDLWAQAYTSANSTSSWRGTITETNVRSVAIYANDVTTTPVLTITDPDLDGVANGTVTTYAFTPFTRDNRLALDAIVTSYPHTTAGATSTTTVTFRFDALEGRNTALNDSVIMYDAAAAGTVATKVITLAADGDYNSLPAHDIYAYFGGVASNISTICVYATINVATPATDYAFASTSSTDTTWLIATVNLASLPRTAGTAVATQRIGAYLQSVNATTNNYQLSRYTDANTLTAIAHLDFTTGLWVTDIPA